jgi:hypothetical protein
MLIVVTPNAFFLNVVAPNIKIQKEKKSSIFQQNKKIDILNKCDEKIGAASLVRNAFSPKRH